MKHPTTLPTTLALLVAAHLCSGSAHAVTMFQIAGGFTSSTNAGGTQGNVINTTTGAPAGSYSISLADGANNPLSYQSNVDSVVNNTGGAIPTDPDTVAIRVSDGVPGDMEILTIALNVTDPDARYQQIILESGRIGGNVFGGNGNSITFTPMWAGGGTGVFYDAPGAVNWVAPYDSTSTNFVSGTSFQATNEFLSDPDQWRFTFPRNVTSVDVKIEVNDYNGAGANGNILNDTLHVSFIIAAPEPSRPVLIALGVLLGLARRRR